MAKIFYKCAVTFKMSTSSSKNTTQQIQEMADDLLKYLPPNSTVDQLIPLAVISLAIPYMVVFDAPFFTDDQEIEVYWMRDFVDDGKGNIHEFNVMTKIEYRPSQVQLPPSTPQLPVGVMNVPFHHSPTRFDAFDEIENIDEMKDVCKHEWIPYTGFTQSYEYCKYCDKKKSDVAMEIAYG